MAFCSGSKWSKTGAWALSTLTSPGSHIWVVWLNQEESPWPLDPQTRRPQHEDVLCCGTTQPRRRCQQLPRGDTGAVRPSMPPLGCREGPRPWSAEGMDRQTQRWEFHYKDFSNFRNDTKNENYVFSSHKRKSNNNLHFDLGLR